MARLGTCVNPSQTTPPIGASLQPCPPPTQQEQTWPGNLCPPAEVESRRLSGQQKTVLKDGFKGRGPRAQTPLSQNLRPPLSLTDIGTQAIRARCFQGLSMSPCELRPQACVVVGPRMKGSFLYTLSPEREKMSLGLVFQRCHILFRAFKVCRG